jgi:hypothetical protein
MDLLEHFAQRHCGIVDTAFCQITDVAEVVALAVLVDIFVDLFLAANGGGELERFQNAHTVSSAAAQIVGFANPRFFPEFLYKPSDVERVNIVTNQFALVAEDPADVRRRRRTNCVDIERLPDAGKVGRIGVVSARVRLFQRQLVQAFRHKLCWCSCTRTRPNPRMQKCATSSEPINPELPGNEKLRHLYIPGVVCLIGP